MNMKLGCIDDLFGGRRRDTVTVLITALVVGIVCAVVIPLSIDSRVRFLTVGAVLILGMGVTARQYWRRDREDARLRKPSLWSDIVTIIAPAFILAGGVGGAWWVAASVPVWCVDLDCFAKSPSDITFQRISAVSAAVIISAAALGYVTMRAWRRHRSA